MGNKNVFARVRKAGAELLQAIAETSEAAYLVLLSLYVLLFLLLKFGWAEKAESGFEMVRVFSLSMILWGSTLYFFFVIARWLNLWKNNLLLILTGAVLLGITYWFSRRMSTNAYTVVTAVFFGVMACGKSYRKMLRCILAVVVVSLLLAAALMPAGLTLDLTKGNGSHSFGIVYPNTWGYIAFLGMMIAWYLFMRQKPFITFPFFCCIAVFMYVCLSCRTITLLSAVFPPLALLVDALEDRAVKQASEKDRTVGPFGWVLTAMPFLALFFQLFASLKYEWIDANLPFSSFTYRFIHNGLYFNVYGFPIFGNPYRSNEHTYVRLNGKFVEPGILDSSYASYIIMRGMVWITYTLAWLCLAVYKGIKKKDYAIPFLCAILLVFAMIERPGLDLWYNFILLYPLAAVAGHAGEASVPAAEAAVGESEAASVEAVEAAAGDSDAAPVEPAEAVADEAQLNAAEAEEFAPADVEASESAQSVEAEPAAPSPEGMEPATPADEPPAE